MCSVLFFFIPYIESNFLNCFFQILAFLVLIAEVINAAPAVSSPVDNVPEPWKLNTRPGLLAKTASLSVKSLPVGIVHDSVFEIVPN